MCVCVSVCVCVRRVCVRYPTIKKITSTSIGQSAAALGGILREVMSALRQKDFVEFKRTGLRRYWIITSAEEAAANLKELDPKVLGRLWTRDFSAMYTSLPRHRLLRQVCEAIHEAFEYQAKQLRCPMSALGLKVKYDYSRKAKAQFQQGAQYSERDVQDLLEAVLEGTLLQQGPRAPVFTQVQGIPMGGKASSEIANLYCYAIEAAMVSQVQRDYGIPAAKIFATNQRFIDDIQGFGEINWPALQYGMEHRETTEPSGSTLFLGMRITRHEDSLLLEQEPKGRGWAWRPQKYLEASSTHTHFTRRSVFKGQCVRAGKITNTRKAFKDAVLQVAEGLVLRGYGIQSLQRSWREYLQTYFKTQTQERQLLEEWFQAWMSAAFPQEEHPDSRKLSEREINQLADKAWTAVSEVLRAMELRPLGKACARDESRAQVMRSQNALRARSPRDIRTEVASATALQLLRRSGLAATSLQPNQEPDWQDLQAVVVVKSYEYFVFERIAAYWVRVRDAMLTKVGNPMAVVRAAASEWGRLICVKAPEGAAQMAGLLEQIAAGGGAVAIAPRDIVEDGLPFPPQEPTTLEIEQSEELATGGLVNVLQPNPEGIPALEAVNAAEMEQERHGDPLVTDAPQPKKSKVEERQWKRVMVGTIALLGCGELFRCPIEGCTFEKEQPQNVLKHFVRHRDKRNAESSQLEE